MDAPGPAPARRHAATYSATKSRRAAHWVEVNLECRLSKRQYPSWCRVVSTMYLMPASAASPAHASASNFVGRNRSASLA